MCRNNHAGATDFKFCQFIKNKSFTILKTKHILLQIKRAMYCSLRAIIWQKYSGGKV